MMFLRDQKLCKMSNNSMYLQNLQEHKAHFFIYCYSDCKVSMKEYLAIRRKLYKQAEKEDMPEEEEYFVKLQFKLLDDDDSGMVDYREFTKHEATKVLLGRDKVGDNGKF